MIKYYRKIDMEKMIEDSGIELTSIEIINLVYMIDNLSSSSRKKLAGILLKMVEDEERRIVTMCSYCKKYYIEETGLWAHGKLNGDYEISHGICPDCYQKAIKEVDNV